MPKGIYVHTSPAWNKGLTCETDERVARYGAKGGASRLGKKRPYTKEKVPPRPWAKSFYGARERCTKKTLKAYRLYGGKGVRLKMTMEDFKFLWFRDRAYEMKRASIDRIDSDGHYELSNCRFLELSENGRRSRLGVKVTEELKRRISQSLSGRKKTKEHIHNAKMARWYPKDYHKNKGD